MKLRPSLLPKLAECPCFEPLATAGPAADRGTLMDTAFRQSLLDSPFDWSLLDQLQIEAVNWAVDTARIFASRKPILAKEDDLRVAMCGMEGTADAACPDRFWSADLKSGQIRGYTEQQAAYALGFMERFFVEEWTTHLLFCDERQVVSRVWTLDEAETMVRHVQACALDANAVPAPNEYCGWCAKRYSCRPRLELVAWWIGKRPDELNLEECFRDPAKLAGLLEVFYDIGKNDGLLDAAKDAAKKLMLDEQTDVPGWKLQSRKGSEFISATQFERYWTDMGFARVLQACGNVSREKFAEAWNATYPGKPFPTDIAQQGAGSTFVARATRSKKPTK